MVTVAIGVAVQAPLPASMGKSASHRRLQGTTPSFARLHSSSVGSQTHPVLLLLPPPPLPPTVPKPIPGPKSSFSPSFSSSSSLLSGNDRRSHWAAVTALAQVRELQEKVLALAKHRRGQ